VTGSGLTFVVGSYGYPLSYGYDGLGEGLFGLYGAAGPGLFDLFGDFGAGYFGADYGGGYVGPGYGLTGSSFRSSSGIYDPFPSSGLNVSDSGFTSGSESRRGETGALRLKIKQRQASVYIDGEPVGLVDQYDGVFQKLRLSAGNHRVELRASGYETSIFNVRIEPDRTETYRGVLEKR
jgi:hypothetical protein